MEENTARSPLPRRIVRAFRKRVIDPSAQLLKQGVTPKSIAASMATGAVIGVFPVLGTTTVICLLVALVLRLNVVAIQALNWLVYPLQVLLIIPFIELGQRLFSDVPVALSLAEVQDAFARGWLQAVADLWDLILNGVFAWAIVALPVGVIVYLVLLVVVRRVDSKASDATRGR